MRHFLDLRDLTADDLRGLIAQARQLKATRGTHAQPLRGKTLAMIFEKNSTRTRVSFEVAMRELGGDALVLKRDDLQIGRGETIADTARVLSRYVQAMMLRANTHAALLELAQYATVPVINGLTNLLHPCQLLADLLTIEERLGDLHRLSVAWVGDGNNMANTWITAAQRLGFSLRIACPQALPPQEEMLADARAAGADITLHATPQEAVTGAQVVTTDTWVSMGDDDTLTRKQAFAGFQVNTELMRRADPRAIFLHCLPAHRGEEVSDEVLDGAQSAVWDEAENRLHTQKAVLLWCLS